MTEYDEGHPRGGPGAGPGPGRRRPGGPPPGTLATIALVLSVAGVVVPVALAGATFPGPDATPEVVAARIRRAMTEVPVENIIVAPDCGLKYLPRDTAYGKMRAMVEGANLVRESL